MAVATRTFFDMMADNETLTAMLFGDACYNVTGPMVQIAHQWDMFQLSYADTNPMLSDRDKFPNFYRTVPSDSDFNPARLALFRHFNWTSVGTLFQDAKLGRARHGYAHNRFDSLMEKNKINISKVESFADDPGAAIKNLKDHDVRIIVGNFDEHVARKVFCSAHEHGMYGPKYQWIILGTYGVDWWMAEDSSIRCSRRELNETLHGYLATDVLPLSTSESVTESGITPSEYLSLYDAERGGEFSNYHGYAYDGVWVVAKALDRLMDEVNTNTSLFRGPAVGKVLNDTSFLGVTGRVQFLNGDRVGSMTILQMQYGHLRKIGEYHALTDSLDFTDGQPVVWRDGKPPRDRSIKIEELRHISMPVYIGLVTIATIGITMAALFLVLNIAFRRHSYIKMSSPNMNNLIIIGCILCYVSIILLGAEQDKGDTMIFRYWCIARSWTLALGFTLAFGAMFGKTWRVHAIFTNIKLNKKVIKDYKLMLLVLVLVLLDAIILVTWHIVDPFEKATKRLTPEVYEDVEIIPKIDYCTSQHMKIWLGALYCYKGLLLAFGCFLAWETRQVSIPALNDSKYIGMSVYNVVIMCVCGAAVSFIIHDRPTTSFIIIGLFIIFCTTITLCLVFLPKVIQLRRNPDGDDKRVRATLRKTTKKTVRSETSQHKEKIRVACEENCQLRAILEQRAGELEDLLSQLGNDNNSIDDASIQSAALLHKTVRALQRQDPSPAHLSIRSYNPAEMDCASMYSEVSAATTTLFVTEESPTNCKALKARFHPTAATKWHQAEAIEMAGVRYGTRKGSGTLPPAAEEEEEENSVSSHRKRSRLASTGSRTSRKSRKSLPDEDDDMDPFGGVYLGPSEPETKVCKTENSRTKVDQDCRESEREPLVSHSGSCRRNTINVKVGMTSGDLVNEHPNGTGGLMTSFGSVDTNPGNLTRGAKESPNGLFPNMHAMGGPPAYTGTFREVSASDDIVLL